MIQKTSLLLSLLFLSGCAGAQPQKVDFTDLKSMRKVPEEKTLVRASCPGGDYLSWNPPGGYWQCAAKGLTYPASSVSIGGQR